MCGRYVASRALRHLLEEFSVSSEACDEPLRPNYNVAPTTRVPAVLSRRPPDADEDAEPVRQLRNLRWGLVPSWSKDVKIGARMINARGETVAEKPSFRRAFAHRRCLLPADGYYEWQAPAEAGKGPKTPMFIRPADERSLPLAGIYEFWRDRSAPAGDEAWLVSCAVITTRATDDLGHVHDRMPMMVETDRWETWLDPRHDDTDALHDLLLPVGARRLETFPVSTAVNNVRNNGPHLIEPVEPHPSASS